MSTQPGKSDANRVEESLTLFNGPPPSSLLRTQWLDVPVGKDVEPSLTWGAFSELFQRCLRDVFLHVSRRVDDRSSLGGVVTAVLVENLEVLVSPLGEREKLGFLLAAADLLIARRASADPRETDGCERVDRGAKVADRAADA